MTCFEAGECLMSNVISTTISIGSSGCHQFCRKNAHCHWFTYRPNNACVIYSDCSSLSKGDCPGCISGQSECPLVGSQCWLRGICKGKLIKAVLLIKIYSEIVFLFLFQWNKIIIIFMKNSTKQRFS
jgi:hypothetical protein